MKRTSRLLIGTCFTVTLVIQGCEGAKTLPPPTTFTGPPVTATASTSDKVAFTASVVYRASGPTWLYTVASATGSPITAIDIIAPRGLKDCTLTAPVAHVESTIPNASASEEMWKLTKTSAGYPTGFSDHGGAPSVTFAITCKQQQNGPTYLLVNDQAGTMANVTTAAGQNILGPIAGPN